MITVTYFFPPRRISWRDLLAAANWETSHDAISSISFRGFFLFDCLSYSMPIQVWFLQWNRLDLNHLEVPSTVSMLFHSERACLLSVAD